MKPKLLFTLATIYMALVGILLQAFPIMAFGLAPDAPASLIANIRVPAVRCNPPCRLAAFPHQKNRHAESFIVNLPDGFSGRCVGCVFGIETY